MFKEKQKERLSMLSTETVSARLKGSLGLLAESRIGRNGPSLVPLPCTAIGR